MVGAGTSEVIPLGREPLKVVGSLDERFVAASKLVGIFWKADEVRVRFGVRHLRSQRRNILMSRTADDDSQHSLCVTDCFG